MTASFGRGKSLVPRERALEHLGRGGSTISLRRMQCWMVIFGSV
ncbi:hypothetical protein [Sinomonas sp. G460-2]